MLTRGGWRSRGAAVVVLAAALVLPGCSAAGFGEGMFKAVLLLFFFGLFVPAALIWSVVLVVVLVKRSREKRSGPPGPPGPPGPF